MAELIARRSEASSLDPAGKAPRASGGGVAAAAVASALLASVPEVKAQTPPLQPPASAPLAPPKAEERPSPLSGTMPVPSLTAPAPTSQKIAEIVVRGGKTVTPETIAFYLGVKVGDPYDPFEIRRSFPKLWDSGLFEEVSLEKEDVPGGVRIVAVMTERARVTDLEFRGNKKLTTSQLKDKLKEGKAEIRVGGPLSMRDVAKAKTTLTEAYRAEGFRSAAVDATIEKTGENERRLVFLVDEGDKIKIEEIRFTGNASFGAARLLRAMKKTREAHWYQFWDSKDVYNQASYEEDVESIKHLYQDNGFKDVVVKDPVVETFVVNPEERRPEKVRRRARITIPIVEGEKFTFGDLTLEGTTLFDPVKLRRLFLARPGKPLSRAVLVDGMKSVEALYRERGYIYIFMNPEFAEKPNKVVDVTVKVTEGDQYRLGRVEFSGNKTTRDKVLRRELQLFEGDIMDMEAFKKGLFKITQLGYFKIEEDPDFRVNNEKKTVEVTVKGTDTNRNEVQFGAGYSQLDGLFGQFQFATRNFLGRGDTIGVQFQRGGSTNYFDLSFAEPWFLDKRMSIGAAIFNRSINYLYADQSTKGINASVGWGLGLFDNVSLFYQFTDSKSRYEVFPAPVPPGGGTPPVAFGDFYGKTSGITPGYRYDSRNDPFDPSRGKRYGLSVTLAGGLLGGDFNYVKAIGNATWFVPATRKSYFAVNVEAGIVRPYGGQTLSIIDRFRIGGDRSIRGFQYGSVFPLDDDDQAFLNEQGAILGGDKMAVLNLEYVYALGGPVKLAGFLDAGNTWLEGQSLWPPKVRSAAGVELRLFLPIFQAPIRFIYAVNLDPKIIKDSDGNVLPSGVEKRTDFQFSIGTTF